MEARVSKILKRFAELEEALAKPDIFEDQKLYRELAQEHAHLSEIKATAESKEHVVKSLSEHNLLLQETKEEEMASLLREEISRLENELKQIEAKLENLLVPPDPEDSRNVIIEVRAGTGGDEAALFVGDCVRMYQLYANRKGWKYETLACSPSERGGFKEYVMVVSGPFVKRLMQYEGGTHRVQRVPETESQGRIHTSAITVAVLVEPGEEEELKLDEKDLRIDTYRSSGAGGQHVNTTDSAVRITHIPTGAVAYCQEERSQHKNKDKALRLLKAKIMDTKRQKREAEESALRASQVGSGDRSERIRTYNFPQSRVTDHRIHLTMHNLDEVLQGGLEPISTALVTFFHQQKLAGNENPS